jgi:hypothetical protein
MRNLNQMQQPVKELLWLVHVARLWTHHVDSKKQASEANKKDLNQS